MTTHNNYLTSILERKRREINTLSNPLLQNILKQEREPSYRFSQALKNKSLTVVAEIKRKSPSLGVIHAIQDPVDLALKYAKGGASAISILTDQEGFGGSLDDLKKVRQALPEIAILRKDFILSPLQLSEAVVAGADAVLLIAAALQNQLLPMLQETHRLGLEALVEIHNIEDLELALQANASIIGINHRNLKTFDIDLEISDQLRPLIPSDKITVAESGIHTIDSAAKMRRLGYDAILIGEALVRSDDPSTFISQIRERSL